MSDPKWATDIANNKPPLTYPWSDSGFFSGSGSSTTSASAVGAKRDTIWGHTNRIHIWTPGTFTGAISFAKNFFSSAMFDILGLFVGGKSETIFNNDSRKIFGSQKRIRLGYKLQDLPYGKKMALIPGLGGLLNWIGEMTWKEESFSRGDRSDTVHGNIDTLLVNGGEKKIFSNNAGGWKNKGVIAGKIMGLPVDKPMFSKYLVKWEGLTYSTINAATGYSFATDKSYIINTEGNNDERVAFYAGTGSMQLFKHNNLHQFLITTDSYVLRSQNSFEKVSKKKTIETAKFELSSKEGIVLEANKKCGLEIKEGGIYAWGKTDLGGPKTTLIDVVDIEEIEDEIRRKIEQERQEELKRMHERFDKLLKEVGEDALMNG